MNVNLFGPFKLPIIDLMHPMIKSIKGKKKYIKIIVATIMFI